MVRSLIRNVTFLAALGLVGSTAQAGFNGSFAVAGLNTAYSPSAGLGGASSFTFSGLLATADGLGSFAPSSPNGIAAGTFFNTTTLALGGTGFTFSNATSGTFRETSTPIRTTESIHNGVIIAETFYVLGTYVGGAVGVLSVPASFTISFTQDGGPGTAISSSGTLTIPPTGLVPEPASVAMVGMGLAGIIGLATRRRMIR